MAVQSENQAALSAVHTELAKVVASLANVEKILQQID
jgi:hypothetical protein